uniref:Protein kinase domain-containing protein n=1 Tax=Chromera velia CCMP2878 TaxID=1169474 RepID=A0A0G4HPD8_9ALVE|eukprot:Cvel_7788.t1-p1 / transcript=Cvel_7788.t1 / gene=Cvel_7788 / organism=Chromera_velia_CCMP2878 / gene_product=Putative ankyrin repeat protein MM_0045, putative / transcript_product=Putative ankyrin repeat protein MM_0045, putative / location=Cvel_scaffold415:25225-31350(-) / protein_length=1068 / sequence_SO=supercontig / SO=protein_coding / is_pseudo=false
MSKDAGSVVKLTARQFEDAPGTEGKGAGGKGEETGETARLETALIGERGDSNKKQRREGRQKQAGDGEGKGNEGGDAEMEDQKENGRTENTGRGPAKKRKMGEKEQTREEGREEGRGGERESALLENPPRPPDTRTFLSTVEEGEPADVLKLLDAGADPNARDKDGKCYTALHIAAKRNEPSSEIIKMLVKAGALVEAKARNGNTALHLATWMGHPRTVEALLEAGADVRAIGKGGGTALHVAALQGHPLTVEALLEAGADLNVIDDAGWSVLHSAVGRHPLLPSPEIVKMLVDAGADVTAVEENGFTSLHTASENEQPSPEVVRLLVEAGTDVNAKNKKGSTALHVAARQGHPSTVESLLEAGADAKALTDAGWSVLHHAAKRDPPSLDIVKMLVEAGADVKAKTQKGKSAEELAASHAEIARYLHFVEKSLDDDSSLAQIAVHFRSCLLRVRSASSCSSSRGSQGDKGLGGLPECAWGEMGRILRLIASPGEEQTSASPGAPPVPATRAIDAAAAVIPSSPCPPINEGSSAVESVKAALRRAEEFYAFQRALREKVEKGNSDYLKPDSSEGAAPPIHPIPAEETAERDVKRLEAHESLEPSLLSGTAAFQALVAYGRSNDCESMDAIARRLNRACDCISRIVGVDLRATDPAAALTFLSCKQLCKQTLSLAEGWVSGRKAAVKEVRTKTEAVRQQFAQSLLGDSSFLPEAKTCSDLEAAEKAQTELYDKMRCLEDVHTSGETGKQVVGGIVNMCLEVVRRLKELGGLGELLESAKKEKRQIAQGVSLCVEREKEGTLLARPLLTLTELLKKHKQEKKEEETLELKARLATLQEEEEEAQRLQTELQQLRENSKRKDLPASIARERARLLSLASLHFPELLWEGGTFLPLVRLDVQEVVRAEAPSMLEKGVLVQGRSCRRDFTNETVISEPSPQSGRFARVTSCFDLQGREWVLKRYEIGGGTGERQSLTSATAASRHFYRQAAMLQELHHPHLVQVTAVWQEGIFGFVQMPRYPGGDLAAWMDARPAEGGRDPSESLRLAEDLLSALSFLHQRGKVHCDVKPKTSF